MAQSMVWLVVMLLLPVMPIAKHWTFFPELETSRGR
jgi:hypothetical protein